MTSPPPEFTSGITFSPHEPSSGSRRVQRIRDAARALGLVIGLTQTWVGRYQMNPDGVSYVDIAIAVTRGEGAASGYWSPLYSWILAAFFALARPSLYWEFALVKVVNLALFTVTFAAFEFYLRELLRRERKLGVEREADVDGIDRAPVAEYP